MAPKSASKTQLIALNNELAAANQKMEEELLALRPLLRVIEAQKNTIRCQQEIITSMTASGGGQPVEEGSWDFDTPEKEMPQYKDLAMEKEDGVPEVPREGLYVVYTDGSCIGNGHSSAPGGWAAVITVPGGGEVELSGGAKGTTNNRMELIAAIKGLSKVPRGAKVKLVSDSQYVINGLQKGWAKSWRRNGWYKGDGKKALNPDLWKVLLEQSEQHQMIYEWVRGHNGHRYNERCDELATRQAEKLL